MAVYDGIYKNRIVVVVDSSPGGRHDKRPFKWTKWNPRVSLIDPRKGMHAILGISLFKLVEEKQGIKP